ncbi:type I toxin-antitoxin system toxin [Enterococcus faecalis]
MNESAKIYERRGLLSIAEAIAQMITFGSLISTLIFGILKPVKDEKKK